MNQKDLKNVLRGNKAMNSSFLIHKNWKPRIDSYIGCSTKVKQNFYCVKKESKRIN